MRYAVFIDWENLWLEVLGRCYPSLTNSDSSHPNVPATKALSAPQLELLRGFPKAFIDSCVNQFGCPPSLTIATAIWDFVPLAKELDLTGVFSATSIKYTKANVNINTTSPKHRENASDFKLVLDVMTQLFIDKFSDKKGRTPATLAKKPRFDTIVLVSGDYIFAQLIDFVHTILGLNCHLVTHFHNIAGPLYEKMSGERLRAKLHFLDRMPAYQSFRSNCLKLDVLHQHKQLYPAADSTILAMTAIKRINDRRGRDVNIYDIRKWIDQWILYWNQECGRNIEMTSGEALQILELKRTITTQYNPKNTNVHLTSARIEHIEDALSLNSTRPYAFEHLYDVPPVHYRRRDDC